MINPAIECYKSKSKGETNPPNKPVVLPRIFGSLINLDNALRMKLFRSSQVT